MGTARSWFVGGRYFETLGVPLIRGRLLDEHDDAAHPRVIVINQTMARTYWPGQDPIGKRIQQVRRGPAPDAPPPPMITVVGVVGDMRTDGLDRPVPASDVRIALAGVQPESGGCDEGAAGTGHGRGAAP